MKIGLSVSEWQALVAKSVKVEAHTREAAQKAIVIREQDRSARQENPLSAESLAGRATLHKMQLDLNAQIQGEIDSLKTTVGSEATTRIEAYLQGPLAASTSRVQFTHDQVQAMRSQNGEAK